MATWFFPPCFFWYRSLGLDECHEFGSRLSTDNRPRDMFGRDGCPVPPRNVSIYGFRSIKSALIQFGNICNPNSRNENPFPHE